MIISDERFAAGAALDDNGRRTGVAFDDVGCLLAFDNPDDLAGRRILARFVRDASTRQWLDAQRAVYVQSQKIETPMASGIAALATQQEAQTLQQTVEGQLLNFESLGTSSKVKSP